MIFKTLIQRLHLWVGLVLGVQVMLWMLSGVIMSWFHITLVRGETNSLKAPPHELAAEAYASPGGVIAQTPGATSVELRTLGGRPVYEVRSFNGSALFDASTGEKLSPIGEHTAREVAETDFAGDGALRTIRLLEDPPHEYRGARPVWRADFDDALSTRIYVSPETGKIAARRNTVWRVYDFFWMLHIMDYKERDDFNNPLVKVSSAAGFIFALTGLFMLIFQKSRRLIVADVRTVKKIFARSPQAGSK